MARTWREVKIDIHRALLRSAGGVRHRRAGYLELACNGGHDLLFDGTCYICGAVK